MPGSALTIAYEHEGGEEVDPSKVQTRLWLPDIDDAEVMWCGLPPSPEDLAKDIKLTSIQRGWTAPALYPPKPANTALPTILHTLPNVRPPTSVIASINGPSHTTDYLLKALHEARRNKSPREIELMKRASEVTAGAHRELMRLVGSGAIKDENAAEAEFVAYCRRNGAKYQAYMPIVAAGTSAGTLHYVDNDRPFPSQPPTLLLVDAGAEWRNYAADVTRCIPIGNGGRFTRECRDIYETVLAMQEEAFKLIKPGTDWEAIQRLMCVQSCNPSATANSRLAGTTSSLVAFSASASSRPARSVTLPKTRLSRSSSPKASPPPSTLTVSGTSSVSTSTTSAVSRKASQRSRSSSTSACVCRSKRALSSRSSRAATSTITSLRRSRTASLSTTPSCSSTATLAASASRTSTCPLDDCSNAC